ncbi:MAG TPA: hypothetical protein VI318_17775 [Baekduia sp.]
MPERTTLDDRLDDRLRAAHARIPEPAPDVVAAARARLEAAAWAEETATPPRRRWPRRAPRLVLAAAALAVAAAVVVALWPGRAASPTNHTHLPNLPGAPVDASAAERACLAAPSGSAHACLTAVAQVAGAQDAVAGGTVFYQRNRWVQASTRLGPPGSPGLAHWRSIPGAKRIFMVVREAPEEIWLTAEGGGEIRYGADGPWRPASAWDRRAWRDAGSPDLDRLIGAAQPGWGPKDQHFGRGELERVLLTSASLDQVLPSHDLLSVVPHTPDAIAAWLRGAVVRQTKGNCQHSTPDACAQMRRSTYAYDITVFLRWPFTPPAQRRALLQVLAAVPGARLLHGQRDLAGRRVATILLPGPGADGEDVIAFDPRTSRLVAQGTRQGDSVRWTIAYAVRTAAVDRVGERP